MFCSKFIDDKVIEPSRILDSVKITDLTYIYIFEGIHGAMVQEDKTSMHF